MTNLERDLFSLITLVSNVTEAYSACLFLENKRRKVFQLTTYHSLSPHIIPDASIKGGQGFMGWVLDNNTPLSLNQFDKDAMILGYYNRDEDLKSFMAVPLPTTMTKGALAVDSKKTWSFTNKSQKILAGFAQQFAYLVDGALMAAQLERRSINIDAFNSYLLSLRSCESKDQLLNAICLVPRELVPFSACFLVLKDEEAGISRLVRTSGFGELFLDDVPISNRSSVSGHVLKKGESLRLLDLKKRSLFSEEESGFGARSVAAVPLTVGGETIGVLGFTNHQRAQFDSSVLKRAEAIATPVADALARVWAQKRWQHRKEYDSVTGGRSLSYLQSRLNEILKDADVRGRHVALLDIDLNNSDEIHREFGASGIQKLINHTYCLLYPFATDGDILVRQERTRFFLLLLGSSIEHSEAVANHILQTINENPIDFGNKTHTLTACVGATCFPDDARNATDLFMASSKALESARSSGINNLCLKGGISSNVIA